MTTQHEDDQRRSGGFRDAVNELFGRGERGDARDTSQLDALDRDEAQRHGEDAVYADDPAVGRSTPRCRRAGRRSRASTARPDSTTRRSRPRPASATTQATRQRQASTPTRPATRRPVRTATRSPTTWRASRPHRWVATTRPWQVTGRLHATDPAGQRTPPEGQPVTQSHHLGDASTPHGGEVRGDTVAPEHVRQGGDPTAHGQVQHGGELRGDPGLASADTRSDADLTTGTPDRAAAVDAGRPGGRGDQQRVRGRRERCRRSAAPRTRRRVDRGR